MTGTSNTGPFSWYDLELEVTMVEAIVYIFFL